MKWFFALSILFEGYVLAIIAATDGFGTFFAFWAFFFVVSLAGVVLYRKDHRKSGVFIVVVILLFFIVNTGGMGAPRHRQYDQTALSHLRIAKTCLDSEYEEHSKYPSLERFKVCAGYDAGGVLVVKELTAGKYLVQSVHGHGSKVYAVRSDRDCILEKEKAEPETAFTCRQD